MFLLQICQFITNGAKSEWDELQSFPFAYHKNQWVGYDNPRSVTEKVFSLWISRGVCFRASGQCDASTEVMWELAVFYTRLVVVTQRKLLLEHPSYCL